GALFAPLCALFPLPPEVAATRHPLPTLHPAFTSLEEAPTTLVDRMWLRGRWLAGASGRVAQRVSSVSARVLTGVTRVGHRLGRWRRSTLGGALRTSVTAWDRATLRRVAELEPEEAIRLVWRAQGMSAPPTLVTQKDWAAIITGALTPLYRGIAGPENGAHLDLATLWARGFQNDPEVHIGAARTIDGHGTNFTDSFTVA